VIFPRGFSWGAFDPMARWEVSFSFEAKDFEFANFSESTTAVACGHWLVQNFTMPFHLSGSPSFPFEVSLPLALFPFSS